METFKIFFIINGGTQVFVIMLVQPSTSVSRNPGETAVLFSLCKFYLSFTQKNVDLIFRKLLIFQQLTRNISSQYVIF